MESARASASAAREVVLGVESAEELDAELVWASGAESELE